VLRDQFYRKIIESLEGQLDPELFERCAAALLRSIWPGLVPIRGGTDAGMDGAIADGKGPPFSLVSTTAKDVLRNLTKNLKSYLAKGGSRRRVILATSQALTQTRRKNLHDRAVELGFQLMQIHDQAAMADLLYPSPKWCKELLGLTGDPAPLSVIPRTKRPLILHTLVGRESDLCWLREAEGDRLLVGQPGSGKTFLLQQLALAGQGLFVVNKDRGEIAAGLRAQRPRRLLVDDAVGDLDLVLDLKQMRRDFGADFSILASCWPGDKDRVAEAMGIPDSAILSVEPLTRSEIVEVVKLAGVHRPNELIREIVDQSEGRPGLAVTLSRLCLLGDVRQVVLGDKLRSSISEFFAPILGNDVIAVLGAFALGGNSGLRKSVVASGLGLTELQLWSMLTELATAGIISGENNDRISVWPARLRHALVRLVFFEGAQSLPIEPFLQQAPDMSQVALTLTGATGYDKAVPDTLLVEVLEEASSNFAWQQYAWLGPEETRWVLSHHPEKAIAVARPGLHHAPEHAIPLLLAAAVNDTRPLHSTPDAPLRIIQDWVNAAVPDTGDVFLRRSRLLCSVCAWVSAGNDVGTALQTLPMTMSPTFQDMETDPGRGMTVTIRYGSVSFDDMTAVQSLWPEVLEILREYGVADWAPVLMAIEEWAYPGRM